MKNVKLYTITNNRGQALRFGANRKTSWSSTRWVVYHLNRRARYGRPEILNEHQVHEIDLVNGSVIKSSATAFMESLPQNVDKIRSEVKFRFGFGVDLSTLETMYRLNAINPLIREDVFAYLTTKGIKF